MEGSRSSSLQWALPPTWEAWVRGLAPGFSPSYYWVKTCLWSRPWNGYAGLRVFRCFEDGAAGASDGSDREVRGRYTGESSKGCP